MSDFLLKQLEKQTQPIDVILIGLGFISFGALSLIKNTKSIRVPLIITRRPQASKTFLEQNGFKVIIEDHPGKIVDLAKHDYICLSDNLELIHTFDNKIVLEMTGNIDYGTDIALRTFDAQKHLVTMNVELQTTVGTALKKIAEQRKLILTDALGDQPGCIVRLMSQSKLRGFKPLIVGNMKRFLDHQAVQEKIALWVKDKGGLAVRQATSFADGTKQSMEMTLVANYFGMKIIKPGMVGPKIEDFQTEGLTAFEKEKIPEMGAVDYMIGPNLNPGIFLIAECRDPNQKKFLSYLNVGKGPRYLLFEPYHLCHLELVETIAKVAILEQETIHNTLNPITQTITLAKFDLKKGQKLDGIGGDLAYGDIYTTEEEDDYLPMGLSEGSILKKDIAQNQPIKLSDVDLPDNHATRLLRLSNILRNVT